MVGPVAIPHEGLPGIIPVPDSHRGGRIAVESSMNEIDVPKPVAIAVAVVLLALLMVGIWWRTSQQTTTGSADAQQAVSRQESAEFSRRPPPTTPDPAKAGQPRD